MTETTTESFVPGSTGGARAFVRAWRRQRQAVVDLARSAERMLHPDARLEAEAARQARNLAWRRHVEAVAKPDSQPVGFRGRGVTVAQWFQTCYVDARVARMAASGDDEERLDRLYASVWDRHRPEITREIGQTPESRDACDEAFATGRMKIDKYDPGRARFVHWLRGIVRRTLLRKLSDRARRGRPTSLPADELLDSSGPHRPAPPGPDGRLVLYEAYLGAIWLVCKHGGYPHQVFAFLCGKVLAGQMDDRGAVRGNCAEVLRESGRIPFDDGDRGSLLRHYLAEFARQAGRADPLSRALHEEQLAPLAEQLSRTVEQALAARPHNLLRMRDRFEALLAKRVGRTSFRSYLDCYPPPGAGGRPPANIMADWCNSVLQNVRAKLTGRRADGPDMV